MHDFGQPLARYEIGINPRSHFHVPTIAQRADRSPLVGLLDGTARTAERATLRAQ